MASVDTIEDNTRFAAEHNAGFPILSDTDKSLTQAVGAMHQMGFANRWTYFVDKDGTIVKIDKEVKVGTAGEDLARYMEELGFPKK